MGKVKIEPADESAEASISVQVPEELSYEEKLQNCSIIAKPMASKKLSKKCYKLIKKALKHKTFLRCGLKDVQKRIRKNETGIVIFAGDITPIDIMCHLPGVCENNDIPYVYTPSRKDLGAAMGVKRGCLVVLIREHPDYDDSFKELKEEINNLSVAMC